MLMLGRLGVVRLWRAYGVRPTLSSLRPRQCGCRGGGGGGGSSSSSRGGWTCKAGVEEGTMRSR